MGDAVHGTFVSHKVSKIRWKPEQLKESEYFITGSLDEAVNYLTLWYYPSKESDLENYPLRERKLTHNGDVTEIKFLLDNKIVVSSSFGSVQLIQITSTDLKILNTWNKLHYFKTGESSPCTGMACFEEDFATVGEDGRITLLTVTQTKPIMVVEISSNSSLKCVCFLNHNEILTGNLRGQMKIWDIRSSEYELFSSFMLPGDHIAATCVTVHPSQKHLLLVGGENGSIYVWDRRKSNDPLNILNAHKGPVSEMAFHQVQPEHLFSCSASGELLHWDTTGKVKDYKQDENVMAFHTEHLFSSSTSWELLHWDTTKNVKDYKQDENVWLKTDLRQHKLEISSLMPTLHKPINSLDVHRSKLICGCDNEAVYIIKNLAL